MRVPKYRHFKPKNRGFIEIRGRRKYLAGKYGSPESLREYNKYLTEHMAARSPSKFW